MYSKFINLCVGRSWSNIAHDCFVVGMVAGIAIGCAL